MALAGHPPHRSVREELPHTAPALSQAQNRLSLGQLSARCAVRITRVFRHGVRCEASGTTFLSAGSLPSSDSAGATATPLFAVVVSNTDPSDFPSAYMPAVPSVTFADRSESGDSETDGISRFSRLECCGMLRFSDSAASVGVLSVATPAMWPSPCQDRVGTRKW